MPADLATALAYRNARFRAFRALGVPVAGGWELGEALKPSRAGDGARVAHLSLRCTTCGTEGGKSVRVKQQLKKAEQEALLTLKYLGCTHLVYAIYPDSHDTEELRLLTKLELLAGDPPR